MRQPKRIPIILEKLKDDDNLFLVLEEYFGDEASKYLLSAGQAIDKLIETGYWETEPDLRLSQAMIAVGFPNLVGYWFYKEDEEVMSASGVLEERDIYFWGKVYNKSGKRLPEMERILIKDLDTSHIKSILRDNEEGLLRTNKKYLEIFNKELRLRQENGDNQFN